jgi:hypothetical protein
LSSEASLDADSADRGSSDAVSVRGIASDLEVLVLPLLANSKELKTVLSSTSIEGLGGVGFAQHRLQGLLSDH